MVLGWLRHCARVAGDRMDAPAHTTAGRQWARRGPPVWCGWWCGGSGVACKAPTADIALSVPPGCCGCPLWLTSSPPSLRGQASRCCDGFKEQATRISPAAQGVPKAAWGLADWRSLKLASGDRPSLHTSAGASATASFLR